MAIKVQAYVREETALGKFTRMLPFLTHEEFFELNLIGHTGKTSTGKKISREKYLNSLGKGTFQVIQTYSNANMGDFREEFTIVRAWEEEEE